MSQPTRRLILMRHAKSDWGTGHDDHARPLNARGRKAAPRIAAELAALGWAPDVVLCSDAARTTETWERMAGAFDRSPRLVRTRQLYLAGLGSLQLCVSDNVSDEISTVLALGHNPGWENAASQLAERPIRMTTANAVLLTLHPDPWTEAITQPALHLHAVLRPKELD